eukprot:Hpha_TRINITY_DN12545_c0_g1::TRINITY_DN12545_c0_g1_i1::g.50815::m.50815
MPEAGEDYSCAAGWNNSEFCALVTLIIHFIHPLLCTINYLSWVRDQRDDDKLGDGRVNAYLILTILAMLSFFLLSSLFYILAHRWPNPQKRASKRTSWGVFFNLILSDVPIFILEVDITWTVGWTSGIQAICMLVTIISFATSGVRSWLFFVGRFIQVQEGEIDDDDEPIAAQRTVEPTSPGALPDAYEQLDKEARGDQPKSQRSAAGTASDRPPGFFLPAHWLEEQHVIPVMCSLVWGISTLVSLLNFMIYLRKGEAKDLYGGLTGAYLAFVVVSLVVYFTIATTMWLWSFRFTKARVMRRQKTTTGILVMFFLSNCPLWAMDYRTVDVAGVKEGVQLASLLFQSFAWLLGAVTFWLTYAYRITTDMQKGRCCPGLTTRDGYRGGAMRRGRVEEYGSPMRPQELLSPEYRWRAMFSFEPPPDSPQSTQAGQFRMPQYQQQHYGQQAQYPQGQLLQPATQQHATGYVPQFEQVPQYQQQPQAYLQPPPTSYATQPQHSSPQRSPQRSPNMSPGRPVFDQAGAGGGSPMASFASGGMDPVPPPPGATVVRTPSQSPYSQTPPPAVGGRAGGIVPEGPMAIGMVPGSPSFGSPPPPQRNQVIFNDLV